MFVSQVCLHADVGACVSSYLVGFGHHVFVNDVHVGCCQGNQSWNDQLRLTLLKTCSKEKQQSQRVDNWTDCIPSSDSNTFTLIYISFIKYIIKLFRLNDDLTRVGAALTFSGQNILYFYSSSSHQLTICFRCTFFRINCFRWFTMDYTLCS